MSDVPSNLIPTRITGLPEYTGTSTLGYLPYVLEGQTYKVQFANIAAVGAVPSTREINTGTGLGGGGDLSANRTLYILPQGVDDSRLTLSGVVAGVYGAADSVPVLTINAQGRVTAATSVPIVLTNYVPTSRTITAGNGLSGGGDLSANRSFAVNFSSTTPEPLGPGSPGVSNVAARGDHVHPAVDLSDTTETQGVLPLSRGGTGNSLSPVVGAIAYSSNDRLYLTPTAGTAGQVLTSAGGSGAPYWQTLTGTGTVTDVSVITANGFAGTVATPTTTAAITLQTTVSGVLKGDGTALSAAVAGTDYLVPGAITTSGLTMSTNRLLGRTTASTGAVEQITVGTGLALYSGSIENSAPDQIVSLTGGAGISVSGTYPSFTITNTAPDQIVSLTGAGTTVVTGTYPNFTITSSDQYVGTVTSVSGTGSVNGITLTGTVTSSGSLTLGGTLSNVSLTSQVTGTLPIANGGTGAATAGAARTNLGAAASGANTDITSIALTSGTILNTPVSGTDIANKTYVDSISAGINFHQAVRLASTTGLPAYTYNNGTSGVGATITANANGALTLDSVAAATNDRVLIKNETSTAAAYNGVYVVTQTGSGATPFILTRATDYNTSGTGVNQIDAGDFFLVTAGSTQANTSWVQQTPLPITVGTTAIVFTQFAAPIVYSAGTGLTLAGTVFSITNTGVTANTYGSASSVPVLAINAQGQVTSASNSSIAIAGSQITSGTVAVAQGGTGANTLTNNGVLIGKGTSAITATAAGLTGQVLVGNTGYGPTWATLSSSAVTSFSAGTTGLTPSIATTGAITLAGTLNVANGGTGATSLTSGYLVKGNGTSAVSASVVYDDGTNVGIGTASPGAKLDVNGEIRIYPSSSPAQLRFGVSSVEKGKLAVDTSSNMLFETAGSERMRIDSSGNVTLGIGGGAKTVLYNDQSIASLNTAGSAYTDLKLDGLNLLFRTGSGSASERMRIDSSGNVGIGTSSPGVKLDVNGQIRAASGYTGGYLGINYSSANAASRAWFIYNDFVANGDLNILTAATQGGGASLSRLYIDPSGNVGIGTTSPGSLLELSADLGPTINLRRSGSANGNGVIQSIGNTGTINSQITFGGGLSNIMTFAVNGSERMRIDSSGNVGIGTTSSGARLQVSGGVSVQGQSVPTSGAGMELLWDGSQSVVQSYNRSTSAYQPLWLEAGSYLRFAIGGTERGRFDSSGSLLVGTTSSPGSPNAKAVISGTADAGIQLASTSGGGGLILAAPSGGTNFYTYTGAVGSESYTERMRIDSSGNLLVGTTSASTYKVNVNGTLGVYGGNGVFFQNGSNNAASAIYNDGASGVSQLQFNTGGAERARIDSSGKVSIGTTSVFNGAMLSVDAPSSGVALGVDWADNVYLGQMYYDASYSMGVYASASTRELGLVANSSDSNAKITFSTGSTGTITERMRIDSSGNVTFANKIIPNVQSVASSATITPNADTDTQVSVTALAVPATLAAPSGTPSDGQSLVIRIKDNGTARALTWTTGSSGAYRAVGITLPTTTVANKTMYIGCKYNSTDLRWDAIALSQEA